MKKRKRNKKGFMPLVKRTWVAPDGELYYYWVNRKTGARITTGFTKRFRFALSEHLNKG